MIRVVVSVLLGVALLAASLPAVEHAAEERSDAQVRAAIDDVDVAAAELARSEEAVPGTAGARRVVTVDVPAKGLAAAEVTHVTVAPSNRTYRYRVAGRSPQTVRGDVPVYTAEGRPLVLRTSGRHRLTVRLVHVGGDRRVVVERGTPADDAGGG